jgi:hypothetical protein
MKRTILALIPALLLTGCLSTPVKRTFPNVPEDLLKACPDLELIKSDTDKLSDVLLVVTDNYGQYHQCRIKVDAWIEWYKTQKIIFDSVK